MTDVRRVQELRRSNAAQPRPGKRRADQPDPEPFGPSREGSPFCQSGSLASGGTRTFCTCDTCF